MHESPMLAVIGGSGLYAMESLSEIEKVELDTPFGKPSSPIIVGTLNNRRVAFLARHGLGHQFSPSEVNYRANIYALKSMGVKRIVGVSACGSLREDFEPGQLVIPNQLFDFTKNRPRTFFGKGLVAHVGVADPFCPDLSNYTYDAVESVGGTAHEGGNFITIEGPRFSTRAESDTFRAWGMSIIGMTTSPEAFLAREAELCYTVIAHVTDYDVWHISEEPVSVEMVIRILNKNTEIVKKAIREITTALPEERACACKQALANALINEPDRIPQETRERLSLLIDKYIK